MVARCWLWVIVVPLVVTGAGCSVREEPPADLDGPSSTSGPTSGVVLGAPAAASPEPSASPTGAPNPEATPSTSACSLPASNPADPVCTSDAGHLLGEVEAAVNRVVKKRPALFDLADKACDDCYKVLDASAYNLAVQAELAARGICTYSDMEEIAAKDSNASSEQFDIQLASGHIRRGPGVYRGICSPAIF